jgi:hypothetical protein
MRQLLSAVLLLGTLCLAPATGAHAQRAVTTAAEAPGGLTATATDARTVELAWNPARDAAGYRVLRATSVEGPFEVVTPRPITATTFRDESLTPRTTYAYQVQAVYLRWEPATSAAVSVTTPPEFTVLPGLRDGITLERVQFEAYDPGPVEPGPPTGVRAQVLGPTGVQLSWTEAPGATGYRVSRSRHSGSGPAGGWTVLTPSPINRTSFTDEALAPDLSVAYRIAAYYPDEDLPQITLTESVLIADPTGEIVGGTLGVTQQFGQWLESELVTARTPEVSLTGFTATAGSNPGTVGFTWHPVDGASHYIIRGPGLGSPEGIIASRPVHFVHGVREGTHTYRLAAAFDVPGVGIMTTPEHRRPSSTVTVLAPPPVTTVEERRNMGWLGVEATPTTIKLSWPTPLEHPDGYLVYRSAKGTAPWTLLTPTLLQTRGYEVSGLKPDSERYYRVESVYADNPRGSSPIEPARTEALEINLTDAIGRQQSVTLLPGYEYVLLYAFAAQNHCEETGDGDQVCLPLPRKIKWEVWGASAPFEVQLRGFRPHPFHSTWRKAKGSGSAYSYEVKGEDFIYSFYVVARTKEPVTVYAGSLMDGKLHGKMKF